jgi:hypothetical protein
MLAPDQATRQINKTWASPSEVTPTFRISRSILNGYGHHSKTGAPFLE